MKDVHPSYWLLLRILSSHWLRRVDFFKWTTFEVDILERIFYEKIYLPLRVNWTWPSAGQNREVKFIPWDHNFVDISAYCRLLYQQWRDRIREGLNWKKKCKISHFWAVGKFLHLDIQIVQPSRWVGTPSPPTCYVALLENQERFFDTLRQFILGNM